MRNVDNGPIVIQLCEKNDISYWLSIEYSLR